MFEPQHFTPPLAVSAQVWSREPSEGSSMPVAIATTPLVSPETSTGVRRFAVVPSPSCPALLAPQHFTPWAVVSAHAWRYPIDTAVTPEVSPETFTGVSRLVVVPSPTCPEPFAPQHFTPPLTVTAQVD